MPNHKKKTPTNISTHIDMMIFTYFHKAVSIQYIYITYRQFRIPVPFQPIIKLITHRYVTQGFSISEQEQ